MDKSRVCFTRSQAAEQLQVSPPTVDKLIHEGKLAAFTIGERSVRIPLWSLERFIMKASGSNSPEAANR